MKFEGQLLHEHIEKNDTYLLNKFVVKTLSKIRVKIFVNKSWTASYKKAAFVFFRFA